MLSAITFYLMCRSSEPVVVEVPEAVEEF
jgi:hypothetical protein